MSNVLTSVILVFRNLSRSLFNTYKRCRLFATFTLYFLQRIKVTYPFLPFNSTNMDMENTINLVNWSGAIELLPFVTSLLLGLVLGLFLRLHFNRFSSIVGNKDHISKVFPYIVVTTVFIITIVKSSLALSLGLVGALSIVRFRTPIKEPEELAYLFIAIAIGLGLGANHIIPTITASFVLMVLLTGFNFVWKKKSHYAKTSYLFLTCQEKIDVSTLSAIISQSTIVADLRRFDVDAQQTVANYIVDFSDIKQMDSLLKALREALPSASISFFDHRDSPKI